MNSRYYLGEVRHRRFTPSANTFSYKLMMFYLDLDEVSTLLSARWWKPFSFKREDYFDGESGDLKQTVSDYILEQLGIADIEQVHLLTQLRCFSYVINPISCYYCFDKIGNLQAMVLEVTNTPWGEKQLYALACNPNKKVQRINFNKQMHVSPFNPMDMVYQWSNNIPDETLSLHLSCWKENEKHLDATLIMHCNEKQQLTAKTGPVRYALMTFKVASLIYFQAAKLLLLKRVPFYSHPKYAKK